MAIAERRNNDSDPESSHPDRWKITTRGVPKKTFNLVKSMRRGRGKRTENYSILPLRNVKSLSSQPSQLHTQKAVWNNNQLYLFSLLMLRTQLAHEERFNTRNETQRKRSEIVRTRKWPKNKKPKRERSNRLTQTREWPRETHGLADPTVTP